MTEEATKPSTASRSNIHSILSDNSSNTFLVASSPIHHKALKGGEAELPTGPAFEAGHTLIPAKRISDQERLRLRHSGLLPVFSESVPGPEKDFQQDHLKRRKLSLVPHSFPSGPICSSDEQRDESLSLITEDDTPIRSFPVREYPRRLSIASVLTADSSSLPSVISPATTTSWTGLASSVSSTTTTNPPQWPFMSELYQPISRRSPIPSVASASTALGSHSRKDQQAFEDPDYRTWELDIEPSSGHMKTPLLRNVPRRRRSDITPFRENPSRPITPAAGLSERSTQLSRANRPHLMEEDELREVQEGLPREDLQPDPQHSLEVYNDVVNDLQHKLSTKTLALETLQKEHDRLLGAYSRQQTRSAAIQKKCTVADAEIVSLSAERDRLQEALDQSEAQVQELTEQRDSINRRLVARVREYSSIIELASQMENLSVLELKKWKDRDTALRLGIEERDKVIEDIQQRLSLAESAAGARRASGSDTSTDEVATLRGENEMLRQQVEELQNSVGVAKQEVQRMEEIGRMLLHRHRDGSDPSVNLPS